MAVTDQQLQQLITSMSTLTQTISRQGSIGAGSGIDIAETFEEIQKTGEATEELTKATNILRKKLEKMGSSYAKQIKTSNDLSKAHKIVSKNFIGDFERIKKEVEQNKRVTTEQRMALESYGLSVKDLNKSTEDMLELQEQMQSAVRSTGTEMRGFSNRVLNAAASVGVFIAALDQAVEPLRSAARFGTDVEFVDAAMAGMSSEELNQLQAQNRQIMAASNDSFSQFNSKVTDGALALTAMTGELKDSVRLQAQAYEQSKILGANSTKYREEELKLYARLHNGLSMTADQFMDLNETLMNSVGVQSQLYRINVKQRGAFMRDLKNTYEKLRLDGATHEQAQRMLETFTAIGAKSPKERLKEAAKMQAVMGAMGMGQQGTEMATMMRRGMRGDGDQERAAEIMAAAQIQVGDKMAQGLASEMATFQMIESTGLQQYLGPTSDFASLNTRQNVAISDQAYEQQQQMGEMSQYLGMITGTLDGLTAITQSGVAATLTKILGAILAWKAVATLSSAASGMFGKAGIKAGAGGMFGKLAAGGGAAIAGTLAAGAAAGVGVHQGYQAITTGKSDIHTAMIGTEIGQSVSDSIGNFTNSVLAFLGDQDALYQREQLAKMNEEMANNQKRHMDQDKELAALSRKERKENFDRLISKTDEVKTATKEQTEEQKRMKEEEKKDKDKGYRLTWVHAPKGNASMA